MYSVSQDYLDALDLPVRTYKLAGTIGGVSFDESNVLSIEISNQVSEGSEIKLGSVYIGELTASFYGVTGIARGSWVGKTIVLSEGLMLADNSFEYVPLGVFTIAEANHTQEGVDVVAYDAMTAFDKARNDLTETGTAYDFLSLMCQKCGVTLGMTSADVAALTNGTETLSIYSENDIETWRDLLSWVAQTLCSVATINRAGELELRQYSVSSAATIDETHRFTGCSFSDFTTYYTGMSVVNIALRQTEYKSVTPDDGLTYNLGSNPLVQGDYDLVQNIIDEFSDVQLVPFSAQMLGGAIYDLCDCLTFSGGIAAGAVCGVMGYTWKYNGAYAVNGFGSNPALATAKSKAQKDIDAIYNTIGEEINQMSVVQNSSAVTCGENTETSILTYNFEVTQAENTTMVDVSVVMTSNASETESNDVYTLSDIVAHLSFYVDGSEVSVYSPEFIVDEGKDTMTFNYSLSGLSVGAHQFDVRLTVDGGSGSIAAGDVHEILWGYGITFEVYIKSIEITQMPNVTAFYTDDVFGYTGLSVMAHYNNGVNADVTEECEVAPASGTSMSDYQEGEYDAKVTLLDGDIEYETSYPFEVIRVSFANTVFTSRSVSELSKSTPYLNIKRKKIMGPSGGSFTSYLTFANDKNIIGVPSENNVAMYTVRFCGPMSNSGTKYTFQNTAYVTQWVPVVGGLVYPSRESGRIFDLTYVKGDESGVTEEELLATYDLTSETGLLTMLPEVSGGYLGQYIAYFTEPNLGTPTLHIMDITTKSVIYQALTTSLYGYENSAYSSVVTDGGDVYILLSAGVRGGETFDVGILRISDGEVTLLRTSVEGEHQGVLGRMIMRLNYDNENGCLVLTTMSSYSSASDYITITTRIYKLDPYDLSLIEEVEVPEYIDFAIRGSWAVSGNARLYLNCTDLYYGYYSSYENRSADRNFGYATDSDGCYIILGTLFLGDNRPVSFGDDEVQCAKTSYLAYTLRHAMYYYDQIPYFIDNIYLQNSPGNFMGEVVI